MDKDPGRGPHPVWNHEIQLTNLPVDCKPDDLVKVTENIGTLRSIHIVQVKPDDKDNSGSNAEGNSQPKKEPTSMACIMFDDRKDAKIFVSAYDKEPLIISGRKIGMLRHAVLLGWE
ncbi:hypothetical protein GGS23DRAFT_599532 [Durotheca rogersii]|uniref:uncharacterized protein n=1 Tax=Durotheca rogersii TaxID=419775 RepID=UPI00221FB885|nr:uncharacterized protein GGS23DRAFT_599532 [Durotheca rogersii]KAI5860436.1 hypothetical protein GGS23DRAFT_599532 [Durotheca rogersii]